MLGLMKKVGIGQNDCFLTLRYRPILQKLATTYLHNPDLYEKVVKTHTKQEYADYAKGDKTQKFATALQEMYEYLKESEPLRKNHKAIANILRSRLPELFEESYIWETIILFDGRFVSYLPKYRWRKWMPC